MPIVSLIDKQDNAEIIRDEIAAILATEVASQVALAQAESKPNPDLWRLRIYQERSNPWENLPTREDDLAPVVNVWWDSSTFNKPASNTVQRQKSETIYNLDCIGFGRSAEDGTGHVAGDQQAAEAVQRAVRLVRNILMAAEYTYLGLRGVVWSRWIDSITMMQPQQTNQNVSHVVGARVAFRVEFNELSPQVEPETLELLSVDVHRTEDNEIVVEADYDYTT